MSLRRAFSHLCTVALLATASYALPPLPAAAEVSAKQVDAVETVKDLLALGANKLSAAEFKARVVGKKMSGPGWTWSIDTDGTTSSASADGSWKEDKAPWKMKGDKYCATLNGAVKCRDVYILGKYLRMSDKDNAKKLSPWTVKLK